VTPFRALVIDDQDTPLNYVAKELRQTIAPEVNLILLLAEDKAITLRTNEDQQGVFSASYSEIWVLASGGALRSLDGSENFELEADDRPFVFFLPYSMEEPSSLFSGAAWRFLDASRQFLRALDTVVVDCNLSTDQSLVGTQDFFTHGTLLCNKLCALGLGNKALIVLNTAQSNINPYPLANIREPKRVVLDKTHSEVITILREQYERFSARSIGLKPGGLALQYAELHNSTSGAAVGHDLSGKTPDKWVELLKKTKEHLGRLSISLSRAGFKEPVLSREAARVCGFLIALDQIPLDDATAPGPETPPDHEAFLGRWFSPAFTNAVPFQVDRFESDGPLEGSRPREIFSFGSWRTRLCRVYLNDLVPRLSWAFWLKEWVQRAAKDSLLVEYEASETTEVFVPQEWLLELFNYLCDEERFLRHVVSTGDSAGPVRALIRTGRWLSPITDKVYKAALILTYDKVCFPNLSEGRECRALVKLMEGPFAVESQKYLYDWYLVRRNELTVEVYEFEVDDARAVLIPRLREDGAIPLWPSWKGEKGRWLLGSDLLHGDQTSGVIFIFESAAEHVSE
jgi:hypothetical protein